MQSNMNQFGYDISIFVGDVDDEFICPICTNVCRQPKECRQCGAMFCNSCVNDWLKKNKECPRSRCDIKQNPIGPVVGALLKMYNNLKVKCPLDNCGAQMSLIELEPHQLKCQQRKCKNRKFCENIIENKLMDYCSSYCEVYSKYSELQTEQDKFNYLKQKIPQLAKSNPKPNPKPNPDSNSLHFKWDANKTGRGIQVTNSGKTVVLKESPYIFRSVISDIPFNAGVHYWEIHGIDFTENEMKIGVTTKKEFNLNSAFCDYDSGFAYYGLGQVRNGSNAQGQQYGKKFKNQGRLGVYLNMNKGTLAFSLNDEYFGVAFTNPKLKQGPIYPAISLLHCAGCNLITGKQPPKCFQ